MSHDKLWLDNLVEYTKIGVVWNAPWYFSLSTKIILITFWKVQMSWILERVCNEVEQNVLFI